MVSGAQPGQANTGHPVASLLLGLPITTSIETLRPIFGYRYSNFGWFAQDDFRVNAHLTLNLGLRYEIETPVVEVNDLQSTFDVQRQAFVFAGRDNELWSARRLCVDPWLELEAGASGRLRSGLCQYIIVPSAAATVHRLHRGGFLSQPGQRPDISHSSPGGLAERERRPDLGYASA